MAKAKTTTPVATKESMQDAKRQREITWAAMYELWKETNIARRMIELAHDKFTDITAEVGDDELTVMDLLEISIGKLESVEKGMGWGPSSRLAHAPLAPVDESEAA
jgi:hypothetical protein